MTVTIGSSSISIAICTRSQQSESKLVLQLSAHGHKLDLIVHLRTGKVMWLSLHGHVTQPQALPLVTVVELRDVSTALAVEFSGGSDDNATTLGKGAGWVGDAVAREASQESSIDCIALSLCHLRILLGQGCRQEMEQRLLLLQGVRHYFITRAISIGGHLLLVHETCT